MCCAGFSITFRRYIVATALALSMSIAVAAQTGPPAAVPRATARPAASDRNRITDDRITSLIRKMSLAEKIGQLQQANSVVANATGPTANHAAEEAFYDGIRQGQIGS